MTSQQTRPRVLFVDDEPAVVEALARSVRGLVDAETATNPFAAGTALEAAAGRSPFAVLVTDLRMPGMDGAALLKLARSVSPDATRMLLTGHADLDHAIAAINDGHAFRFLTKPCPPEVIRSALSDGVEQHRLLTAQRVLLEQTLRGAVEALGEALAMARPAAFARAGRLRRLVAAVAAELNLPERWPVEVAAQLGELAVVTLPEEALDALIRGNWTDPRIAAMLQALPGLTDEVLGRIPRLEPVREILRSQDPVDVAEAGTARQRPGEVLQAVREFDALVARDYRPRDAIGLLRRRLHHPVAVLDALDAVVADRDGAPGHAVAVADLREGMVLAEDLHDRSGAVLASRGQQLSAGLVTLIRNHAVLPGLRDLPAVLA
jgi:FixJ family two-component response regulator